MQSGRRRWRGRGRFREDDVGAGGDRGVGGHELLQPQREAQCPSPEQGAQAAAEACIGQLLCGRATTWPARTEADRGTSRSGLSGRGAREIAAARRRDAGWPGTAAASGSLRGRSLQTPAAGEATVRISRKALRRVPMLPKYEGRNEDPRRGVTAAGMSGKPAWATRPGVCRGRNGREGGRQEHRRSPWNRNSSSGRQSQSE